MDLHTSPETRSQPPPQLSQTPIVSQERLSNLKIYKNQEGEEIDVEFFVEQVKKNRKNIGRKDPISFDIFLEANEKVRLAEFTRLFLTEKSFLKLFLEKFSLPLFNFQLYFNEYQKFNEILTKEPTNLDALLEGLGAIQFKVILSPLKKMLQEYQKRAPFTVLPISY